MTDSAMRTFGTGATRHSSAGKPDYEGALSPLVMRCYATYMERQSIDRDGNHRPCDNWQAGFPVEELMKSAMRHLVDVWLLHDGYEVTHDYDTPEGEEPEPITLEDALCAVLFNLMAYLHELEKAKVQRADS